MMVRGTWVKGKVSPRKKVNPGKEQTQEKSKKLKS
jgi:hypothetical protein